MVEPAEAAYGIPAGCGGGFPPRRGPPRSPGGAAGRIEAVREVAWPRLRSVQRHPRGWLRGLDCPAVQTPGGGASPKRPRPRARAARARGAVGGHHRGESRTGGDGGKESTRFSRPIIRASRMSRRREVLWESRGRCGRTCIAQWLCEMGDHSARVPGPKITKNQTLNNQTKVKALTSSRSGGGRRVESCF